MFKALPIPKRAIPIVPAVVLYTKDDKIQSIQIADKQFFYKLINDVFNK